MSDESSDEEVNIPTPYSQRPDWADVQVIPQDEETNDIVRIAYTDQFKDVYNYFRAILKSNEKSERAFELTTDAALLNPANYTVWYYRRLIIQHLKKDLNQELDFISKVIRSNPKNYQVWQHRRNIVEYLQDSSQELEFTQLIIKKDSKNYHAWQYRQWVIKRFQLWSNELDYVDELLQDDIRNNSAWNQRYFVVLNKNERNLNATNDPNIATVVSSEINYTLEKITKCVDNESSWNYLRAFIEHFLNINESALFSYPPNVITFCQEKMATLKEDEQSPFLLSFMVDYFHLQAKALIAAEDTQTPKVADLAEKAIQILQSLASKYDTIRANYWNYLVSKWKQSYAGYLRSDVTPSI